MPARGSSHLISTIVDARKKKCDGAAAGTLVAPHAHAAALFEPTWDFLLKLPEGFAGSPAALKIRGSGLA